MLNSVNVRNTKDPNKHFLTLSSWVLTLSLLLNNKLQEPPKYTHFGVFQLHGTPDLRYFGVKHTLQNNKTKIRHRTRVFFTDFLLAVRSARKIFGF